MRERELLQLVAALWEKAGHPEVESVVYNPGEGRLGAVAVKFTKGATGYVKPFDPQKGVLR